MDSSSQSSAPTVGSRAPDFVLYTDEQTPWRLSDHTDEPVEQLDFPLLSDHDAVVSAQYGSKYAEDFTSMELDRIAKRSAFVVDGKGIVQYAEVLDNAGQQPDFDAVKETVQSLTG